MRVLKADWGSNWYIFNYINESGGCEYLNKKSLTFIIAMFFIIGLIYYNDASGIFKINKDKVKGITYAYEIGKDKMARFDVTNNVNKEDINELINSLNKGVLKPDKERVGGYTKEHIEILVLGDRWFSIYKQKDGRFTAMYSADPGSNDERDEKQMTIESDVLERYFSKFREASKDLSPTMTWGINGG